MGRRIAISLRFRSAYFLFQIIDKTVSSRGRSRSKQLRGTKLRIVNGGEATRRTSTPFPCYRARAEFKLGCTCATSVWPCPDLKIGMTFLTSPCSMNLHHTLRLIQFQRKGNINDCYKQIYINSIEISNLVQARFDDTTGPNVGMMNSTIGSSYST
jgi:hypothetical protein